MRIKKASHITTSFEVASDYECNKDHPHAFVKVAGKWYECKYIGNDIEFKHGYVYWRAIEQVDEIPDLEVIGTSVDEECMDYVIFE